MPWDLLECSDGAYYINRLAIRRIIKNYVRAQAKCNFAQTVAHPDHFGYVIPLPTTYTVEIDFERVRLEDELVTPVLEEMFFGDLAQGWSMTSAKNQLYSWLFDTRWYEQTLLQKMRLASHQTQVNIESKVDSAQEFEKAAVLVRDMSAVVLLVGATFATGGAAAEGAAGLATFTGTDLVGTSAMYGGMKGIFKYQETGKADEALFTGVSNFTTGLIQLASGATGATGSSKVALIVVGAANGLLLDVAEGAISGKDMLKVTKGSAFKAIADPLLDAAKEHFLEENPRVAFPVLVAAKLVLDRGVDKYTEKEKGAAMKPVPFIGPPPPPAAFPFAKEAKADEEFIDRTVVMPAGPFCPAG
jgi:hypothetical protein